MESIRLRSVRPFLLDSLSLRSTDIHPQDNDRVESYLASKVEDLIEKAQRDSSNNKLPLVRLKVRLLCLCANSRVCAHVHVWCVQSSPLMKVELNCFASHVLFIAQ